MAGVVLSLRQAISFKSKPLLQVLKARSITRHFSSDDSLTQEVAPSDSLEISDSCVARLRELGENASLRVGVEGGGCSGFQYTFELDSPVESSDRIFKKDGVTVIVDESSLQYVRGATIEYHSELIRSAFRVVKNPLAEQGCSCGASFNIKIPT